MVLVLWFVVAIPASEACGDPSDECQRVSRIGLSVGPSCLPVFWKAIPKRHTSWVEDIGCGSLAAVSGMTSCMCGLRRPKPCGEIEHAFGIDQLTVIKRKTIAFERTEDLLDAPAQAIKLHHLFCLFGVLTGWV